MSREPDIREAHATFSTNDSQKQLIIYIMRTNYRQQKIAKTVPRAGYSRNKECRKFEAI